MLFPTVKEFLKSVDSSWSYCKKFHTTFLRHSVELGMPDKTFVRQAERGQCEWVLYVMSITDVVHKTYCVASVLTRSLATVRLLPGWVLAKCNWQYGHAMKAQKAATKTQMCFQQKRKCKINKTATCNSESATSSVSVIHRIKTRSKH